MYFGFGKNELLKKMNRCITVCSINVSGVGEMRSRSIDLGLMLSLQNKWVV